jgi:multiple sugar transport system permease protein/raffinose/stachyose/melibiose transport system permease protein
VSSAPTTPPASRRARPRRLGTGDRIFLTVIIGIPLAALLFFVWLPALASLGLSFTTWDGIDLADIHWIGLDNYKEIFTNYPPFWPAVRHNVIWLLFTALLPTPPSSSTTRPGASSRSTSPTSPASAPSSSATT